MYFRTTLVWFLGLPVTLLLFLAVLISLPFDRSGNSVHNIGRIWARYLLLLSGVKVDVQGINDMPDGPIVFASNHQSAFDILVLQAYLPVQFRWVAKESLFRIPIVGWSMYLAGYIGINRSRAALAYKSIVKAADKIKARKTSIIIFPEGTRSTTGQLLPFKRGIFILAIKSGAPIMPVSINGTKDIMKKGSINISSGNVKLVLGEVTPSEGADEKALMERVHVAIERGLNS